MNVTIYETLLNDAKAEALSVLSNAKERKSQPRVYYNLEERYCGICDGIRKAYLLFTVGDNEIDEAFSLCRQYKVEIMNAYEKAAGFTFEIV